MGGRVLLVCGVRKRTELLQLALRTAGYTVAAELNTEDDICAVALASYPDMVIVEVETPDKAVLEQIQRLNREHPCPVVMFAGTSTSDMTRAAVKAGVSAYIVNGYNQDRIKPILEIAATRFEEFRDLRRELENTKTALTERKLIERAKGILMKQHRLQEDEAYKALRRLAMNRNTKLVEAARNVIAMSEVLTEV